MINSFSIATATSCATNRLFVFRHVLSFPLVVGIHCVPVLFPCAFRKAALLIFSTKLSLCLRSRLSVETTLQLLSSEPVAHVITLVLRTIVLIRAVVLGFIIMQDLGVMPRAIPNEVVGDSQEFLQVDSILETEEMS